MHQQGSATVRGKVQDRVCGECGWGGRVWGCGGTCVGRWGGGVRGRGGRVEVELIFLLQHF